MISGILEFVRSPAAPYFAEQRAVAAACLRIILIVAILAPLRVAAEDGVKSLPMGARILFCGDSITGHGYNLPGGFVHQVERALKLLDPDARPVLSSLGGSGQTVGGWLNIERESARRDIGTLDTKRFNVREELSAPVDALVIMLGMNDVLSPSMGEGAEDVEAWANKYRELVVRLRARVMPAMTVLCTPTPCTEDLQSPQNQLMDKMNARLRALAAELDCRVADTSEQCRALLARGRSYSPRFHLAKDGVHPGEAGHIGIALGMLNGLGYTAAAAKLSESALESVWKKLAGNQLPEISWQLHCVSGEALLPEVAIALTYTCNFEGKTSVSPRVELKAPEGWRVEGSESNGVTGQFILRARSFAFRNACTLNVTSADGGSIRRDFSIPAPWVAGTVGASSGWGHIPTAPAEPPNGPLDEVITAGGDLMAAVTLLKKQRQWRVFLPTVDYTGQDDSGSVDFYGVSHPVVFETGYAWRTVASERERLVLLKMSSQIFAGKVFVRVWINGEKVFEGLLGGRVLSKEVRLWKGENRVVVGSSHGSWQWQHTVSLEALEGDSLDGCAVTLQ